MHGTSSPNDTAQTTRSMPVDLNGQGNNNTPSLLTALLHSASPQMTSPQLKVGETISSCESPPQLMEQSKTPDCLVLLQIASAGKQGSELGVDERAVVMLTAKIFDVHAQTITGPEFQVRVRHRRSHLSRSVSEDCPGTSIDSNDQSPSWSNRTPSPSSQDSLSEECQSFTGLTPADLIDAPALMEALQSLDTWLMSNGLFYVGDFAEPMQESSWSERQQSRESDFDDTEMEATTSFDTSRPLKRRFEITVDGGTGLRLVLHPAITTAVARASALYPYLYRFIDLKKVYSLLYPKTAASSLSLPEMMRGLGLKEPEMAPGYIPEYAAWSVPTMASMLRDNLLGAEGAHMGQTEVGHWPKELCHAMARLCAKMTVDGANWKVYECVNVHYQPKFIKFTETVGDDVVVRARGLPWQTTDSEIHYFFRGLNIAPGGIALVLTKAGRRNGEAVVRFTDREQRELALKKHKHHMNQRYIEIYSGQAADYISVAAGNTEEAETYLKNVTSPSQALIRMRGLPYTVSEEEIIDFFRKANCEVQFGTEGILFVNRRDGRATGDAFVIFSSDEEAERALKSHRQHIGNRYIELFRSTSAEVNQVMNAVLSQPATILPTIWPNSQPTFDLDITRLQTSAALLTAAQNTSLLGGAEIKGLPMLPPTGPSFPLPLATTAPAISLSENFLSGKIATPGLVGGGLIANSLIKIKGMPPASNVNDILNFLGIYWQAVALHGIHLIYTATGEPSGEAFIRFVNEQTAQMVVANKQGHPMTSAATGIQTVIQLSLAGPAETADFVSIPGSQPAINWSATLTPLSAANPYQLLPPLMFPVGQFSQLPATQGALALPNPPLPTTTASTIKLDASLLCSLPTMSGAQASQPEPPM